VDDSIVMRDPNLEARAANTAYAQARAVLEAEPEISARDLVERLRAHAAELAAAVAPDRPKPIPMPGPPAGRSPGEPGLGAAAAEARERVATSDEQDPALG
jgi:hypothetical protein